jgi:hypothetical protein
MDADRLRFEYFRLGMDYYVTSRFAHHAHAVPVSANLLHHAIEMFLKGALVRAGVDEKGRRDIGHELTKLWAEFRIHYTDSELDEYATAVTALDEFEDLRYPENAERAAAGTKGGVEILVGPGPHQPSQRRDGKSVTFYALDPGKIDRLVPLLFKVASVNPKAFLPRGQSGHDALVLHNECAATWDR